MTIITPTRKGTRWDSKEPKSADDGKGPEEREREFLEGTAAVDFVYGDEEEACQDLSPWRDGLQKVLRWIRNGSNARAKEIRVQAVFYFLVQRNQVELAREIGVRKATISQKAVEFRDFFEIDHPAGAARQMRSEEARETFSAICKSNHQKRQQRILSESTGSPTRSKVSSGKRSDLRARVLAAARLPS